jgi:hypothetical protein
MGARCYKVGIYNFVADNIFFLSNDKIASMNTDASSVFMDAILSAKKPKSSVLFSSHQRKVFHDFGGDGYQFVILLDR